MCFVELSNAVFKYRPSGRLVEFDGCGGACGEGRASSPWQQHQPFFTNTYREIGEIRLIGYNCLMGVRGEMPFKAFQCLLWSIFFISGNYFDNGIKIGYPFFKETDEHGYEIIKLLKMYLKKLQ